MLRDPVPEVHVYQNTFISSHSQDKGSYVSQLFNMLPDSKARTYHNNVHLVLNLDRTLEQVPNLPQAAAAGNIWYRFHPNREPVFRAPMFQRGSTTYQTLADLHRDVPGWEADSQYVDPRLTNFSDEYFDHHCRGIRTLMIAWRRRPGGRYREWSWTRAGRTDSNPPRGPCFTSAPGQSTPSGAHRAGVDGQATPPR